jgi:hypothetical protein
MGKHHERKEAMRQRYEMDKGMEERQFSAHFLWLKL